MQFRDAVPNTRSESPQFAAVLSRFLPPVCPWSIPAKQANRRNLLEKTGGRRTSAGPTEATPAAVGSEPEQLVLGVLELHLGFSQVGRAGGRADDRQAFEGCTSRLRVVSSGVLDRQNRRDQGRR